MSSKIKTKEENKIRKIRNNIRRKNAVLYPVYKVFAWDLLCYYSIEYLFLTITKGISPSQVLIVSAAYVISKLFCQIPAVIISEYLGKRKSIILGNFLVLLYIFVLMLSPNFFVICLSQIIAALGYALKSICDSNLLYDSVATKGGDGLYTKLEAKGVSGYYTLDAILSIMAGYLFIINNYIPMIVCAICQAISLFISFKFKDVYAFKKENKKNISQFVKEYKTDIVSSLKFVKRSERLKSYILFSSLFLGIIKIFDTYKSELLTSSGVRPEQFSIIIAMLSLIASLSVGYAQKIQHKLKNKTLSYISITYILSWVVVGCISLTVNNNIAIPIILFLYVVNKICTSQWYIVEGKYLKNFTEPRSREKITFIYNLITSIACGLITLIGSAILKINDIKYAIILVSLGSLALMIVVLDYMKTRFGLKPKQYSKEDIKF